MFEKNVGFLITARLKSKRLPEKIVLEVSGKPLLCHMFERIKKARYIGEIVLCTSTNQQDGFLEEISQREGVSCYRGSEEDVLRRLYQAALGYNLDYFVNITADCPLIDPFFIERTVEEYAKTGADLIRFDRLPLGQGPSGIKVGALKKVCEIKDEAETEVWGDYFTKSGLFSFHNPEVENNYIYPGLKTSIDYAEDYEFIKMVFSELYAEGKIFSLLDIINLVKRKPEILSINAHCAEWGRQHVENTAVPMKLRGN